MSAPFSLSTYAVQVYCTVLVLRLLSLLSVLTLALLSSLLLVVVSSFLSTVLRIRLLRVTFTVMSRV